MKRIFMIQTAALAIVALSSGLLIGVRGFWSALMGGSVYLVPSGLAALLLNLSSEGGVLTQSRAFITGEVLKVAFSLLLMLLVFWIWRDSLSFIPFLLGLFSVSHLVFLLLLRVRDYGR